MDSHEKQLLEEAAELSKENNKMLRSMLRATRWGQVLSVAKWLFIIGLTIGAYYYIQPYLETLIRLYTEIGKTAGLELPSVDVSRVQEVLQKF